MLFYRYLCLFTYLLMPFRSLGAQAFDQGTLPFSVSGHLLHFSPGVSHLLCFFFRVSLPGVSWPTSSPLPWGVPRDGLTGDGFWWFPECMSYPPPFSLLYFIFYGSFSRCILVLSVHFRCSITRRHLLMKVCILFSVFCVVRHVSDP